MDFVDALGEKTCETPSADFVGNPSYNF